MPTSSTEVSKGQPTRHEPAVAGPGENVAADFASPTPEVPAPPLHAPGSFGIPLSASQVVALQRSYGNQATQRFLQDRAPARATRVDRFLDPDTALINQNAAATYLTGNWQRITRTYKRARGDTDALYLESTAALESFTKQKTAAGRREMIRILNAMEEELSREAVSETGDILVGTEFTFTRPELHRLKLNEHYGDDEEGKKQKEAQEQINAKAVTYIYDWSEKVKKKNVGSGLRLSVTPTKAKDTSMNAKRFEYHDQTDKLVWYWVLDMDDGCLETQTQPSSTNKLAEADIGKIIQEHIFDVAKDEGLGLAPHETIGGGHISLDVGTMVGGSATLLIDLLGTLQSKAGYWQKIFADPDSLNAPWVEEQLLKGENSVSSYQALLQDLRVKATKGEIDQPKVVDMLKEFNAKLENPTATALSQGTKEEKQAASHVRSEPQHYQAVNIEHVQKGGGEARLELRRINAQKSYAELMDQLSFILKEFIQESRWG